MRVDYNRDATITNGVMRWNNNGRVAPMEYCVEAKALGLPVDVAKCATERDAELSAILAQYRADPPPLTDEDRAEARAAMGPGRTVVNVVTGRSFRT